MAAPFESRVGVTFGVLNAVVGLLLLTAVFVVVRTRFLLLDLPVVVVAALDLASAVGLLLRARWALRVLRVAAFAAFGFGLALVAALVLTLAFLRGIHGDMGLVGTAISALIIALAVPYVVALPALQLLWLKKQGQSP
jgi:hypothetical protein